ncbi:MAG: O-antigen ligase family protein, partial [Bacteroidales bacterium]|nr:O-antigen ligase family protein [Bacteroidales bacterium]
MNRRIFIEKPMVPAVVLAALMLLCFTSETFVVSCIATAFLGICLYFRKSIRIAVMDMFVIAVLLWEIVITVFVSGAGNAGFLSKQYFFTVYYFILRLVLTDRAVTGNFLLLTSVIVTIISFICIVSFGMFREKVFSSGFESLYDFKYLYRPFGELNNVWASIFLSLTGLIISGVFFLDGKKRCFLLIPFVALVYCLLVSFSRGVYIAVMLLLTILFGFVVTSKIKVLKKCLYVAGLFTVCLLLSLPNGNDVLRTIKMTETVSQQRSLDYRIDAFSYLLPAMKKSPVIGVGSGRYSMAVNEFIYENDVASITDFAPNIVSQLLLEKGIVGTLLWSLIYITCFALSLRCRSKDCDGRLQLFIFMFLTVLLVREMTFPT